MDSTQDVLDFLKKNPDATEEELQEKLRQLQNKTRPIIERAETRRELEILEKNLRDRSNKDEIQEKLSDIDKKNIKKALDDSKDWLDKNYDAPVKEIIKKKRKFRRKSITTN